MFRLLHRHRLDIEEEPGVGDRLLCQLQDWLRADLVLMVFMDRMNWLCEVPFGYSAWILFTLAEV